MQAKSDIYSLYIDQILIKTTNLYFGVPRRIVISSTIYKRALTTQG